jgi:tetratricopeptide (TPR) repeat protein
MWIKNNIVLALDGRARDLQMEHHYFSYEETYRVTGNTVYKNGSWDGMKNGIRVRITGHADLADTVAFTTQIAEKAGTTDEHRVTGNSLLRSTAETEKAVTYFDLGFAKQKKGDLDGAMVDYNQAIRLNPKYPAAYDRLGITKFKKGDLDGAMADYSQAIKLDRNYGLAYRNRGEAKRKKGDFDGAIADFNRAVKLGVTTD